MGALDSDPDLGDHLHREFGPSLNLVHGDATPVPSADRTFSSLVGFTMLHRLRSPAAQDRLFAEVELVLQTCELFVARDSSGSWRFRLIRFGEVCTPVATQGLEHRLCLAGLKPEEITPAPGSVQFRAWRPLEPKSPEPAAGESFAGNSTAGGESGASPAGESRSRRWCGWWPVPRKGRCWASLI